MKQAFTRAAAILLASAAALAPAAALEHLMVVQEVFPGTPAQPDAQYVMMRMTSSGQRFVNGTFVEVQDATGTVIGRFGAFDHTVANGGTAGCVYPNCPAILMGTSAAQTLLGFAFDQIVDAQAGRVPLPAAGGRACFRGPNATQIFDCVAWGAYAGSNVSAVSTNACDASYGTPAAALSPGFALTRKQFSCPVKENSTDFENRFPHPAADSGASANVDADGDTLINVLDCGDADPASLYFPLEVPDLAAAGDPVMLSWQGQAALSGGSTRYDVARASLDELRSTMTFNLAACAAGMVNGTLATDAGPDPPPGQTDYYFVRARNGCGKATYGLTALDAPLDDPCP